MCILWNRKRKVYQDLNYKKGDSQSPFLFIYKIVIINYRLKRLNINTIRSITILLSNIFVYIFDNTNKSSTFAPQNIAEWSSGSSLGS